MRIVIYTHDTFGLGNIRRMLSIAEYLNQSVDNISILLISGSPMVHSFRLSNGIDYVKLPTITRSMQGEYQSRASELSLQESIKMRSNLIVSTVHDFKPDMILVDKKPLGLKKELLHLLQYLHQQKQSPRLILVLRDILDAADVTHTYWKQKGYFTAIERYYERVLILGNKEVYDAGKAYQFPASCQRKTHYCGYLTNNHGPLKNALWVRQQLGIKHKKLLLVTLGGGADGASILKHFLAFWRHHNLGKNVHAVVVYGPELDVDTQQLVTKYARHCQQISLLEFTPHLPSYMKAADVLVCMAGYNTLCEALSMDKRIICIPRVEPVEEQHIRARRFAQLKLLHFIHPDEVNTSTLATAISQLLHQRQHVSPSAVLQFTALEQVRRQLIPAHAQTISQQEQKPPRLQATLASQLHILKTITSHSAMCF